MSKKLPKLAWLKLVKRYQDEEDSDSSIVKALSTGPTGQIEDYTDASLDEVEQGSPGLYGLLDSDGRTIAQCRIGSDGERASVRSASATAQGSSEAALSRSILAATDSWSTLFTAQGGMVRELTDEVKQLRKANDELKTQLFEALAEQQEPPESDHSEIFALLNKGLEVFTQKGSRSEVIKMAQRIIAKAVEREVMTQEQALALLPIVNEELQAQASQIELAGP